MSCIIAPSIPKEFSVTSNSANVQGQVVETCAKGGDSRKVTLTPVRIAQSMSTSLLVVVVVTRMDFLTSLKLLNHSVVWLFHHLYCLLFNDHLQLSN